MVHHLSYSLSLSLSSFIHQIVKLVSPLPLHSSLQRGSRGEERRGEERKEREGKRGRRLICDNRMLTTRSTVLLVTFFIELFSGFLVLWVALFKVQKVYKQRIRGEGRRGGRGEGRSNTFS